MPSGYYTLDQLAKAAPTVRDTSPLDATEPKIEPEEPRDDYHKDWGFYAFLYESQETLAAGGLTSLVPISIGGITLFPPDVWQVPNLELIGAEEQPKQPAADTLGQLIDTLCVSEFMTTDNATELCAGLARLDGCRMLKTIIANASGNSLGPDFSTTFPNGKRLDFISVRTCSPEATRLTVRDDAGSTICTVHFYNPPQQNNGLCAGAGSATVFASFSAAKSVLLQCLQDAFGGACYPSLGCVC